MDPLFTNTFHACRLAMKLASESPGRYGGRYIARDGEDQVIVLDDDDPERYPDANVIAHVTPDTVYPIGRAGQWLNEDGSISFVD